MSGWLCSFHLTGVDKDGLTQGSTLEIAARDWQTALATAFGAVEQDEGWRQVLSVSAVTLRAIGIDD